LVFENNKFSAGFGSACVLQYKRCISRHALSDCIEASASNF
jgi:hypothetical protein